VPPERAKIVVERLMAPDMWTVDGVGYPVSANNPAFNPYNYQTGSVWPHDNGIIAMGFKLYGFGAEAARCGIVDGIVCGPIPTCVEPDTDPGQAAADRSACFRIIFLQCRR
jgi:glycogen debranching enzyme